MSVDVKTLRIGSHINAWRNGKMERVEVERIENDCQVGYITQDNDWSAVDPCEDWLEYIPITEELLKELGFERDGDSCNYILNNDRCDQSVCITHVQTIGSLLIIKDVDEHGEFELMRAFVTYLHELEAMYYHVSHKELIEE